MKANTAKAHFDAGYNINLSGPFVLTNNSVQNPYVEIDHKSIYVPPVMLFGVNFGLPIQNNKAFVELEAGLDMNGSRVMYIFNTYNSFQNNVSYNSTSASSGEFEYTYRLGLNYMLNVNAKGRTPIYLQTGLGIFIKQDKILSGRRFESGNQVFSISPTQNLVFDRIEEYEYKTMSVHMNLGFSVDILSEKEKYLFTLGATGYFGFNNSFESQGYTIDIIDNTNNEMTRYNWSSTSRGGGIVFQLSRRFGFTKNQE